MEHLTTEQIIDFVSIDKLNEATIQMSKAVNGHIRECEKCRCTVMAFQAIYDEFMRIQSAGDFKKFAYASDSESKGQRETDAEAQTYPEKLRGEI